MDNEKNEIELDKAAKRRKRRRQEQTRAAIILASAVGVVLLVVIIIISSIIHAFTKKKVEEPVMADATQEILDVDNVIPDVAQDAEIAADEVEDQTFETEEEETSETDSSEEAQEEEVTEEENQDDAEATEEDAQEDTVATAEEENARIAELVQNKIASMSVEEKVAQLFFVTPGQLMGKESVVDGAGSAFNDRLNEYPVGGILFEADNMRDADTLSSVISNIQLMVDYPMFYGVSDEGGEDSPLIKKNISENVIASEKEIGSSLGDSGAYSAGISIGGELKLIGFNVDFAPYADVSRQKGSVADQRGFGTDLTTTTSLTKNYIKGLEDQSILSTVKYFPSYGDATQDGKNGQVTSQRSKADLEEEYPLYQEAIDAGADFVMISHVGLPKLRGDRRPASLSKEVITDIVREEWGYDGIVITDYMNKSCIYNSYTYAEAGVGAIEAGADMILSVKNFEKSYNGLLDAVKSGQITEERLNESLTRILRLKYSM